MPYVESFEEFRQRQGACVRTGNQFLFRSGAIATLDGTICREPPADQWARLKLTRRYVQVRLENAENLFRETKQNIVQQGILAQTYSNLPPPPSDAAAHLEFLSKSAAVYRDELKRIDQQLEQSPAAQHRRELAAHAADRQQRIAAIHTEALKVTL